MEKKSKQTDLKDTLEQMSLPINDLCTLALSRYFFARLVGLSMPCQLIILLLMKKVMYGHERARKKVERTYVRCRTHLCDMNT